MSKITVISNGDGYAYVTNPDPLDGEDFQIICVPSTGETLEDLVAVDANGYSVALYVQPTQTLTWNDTWITLEITATFSTPAITFQIDGDGTAEASDYHPEQGDTVTLTVTPDPRNKIVSIVAYDENGDYFTFDPVEEQDFVWEYETLEIFVTFDKKGLPHRMPIWMYPYLKY